MSKALLTRKLLEEMKPGEVIASGVAQNEEGDKVKWVAVRGGIADWAVYATTNMDHNDDWIKQYGNKIHSMVIVDQLIPADQTAKDMYRQ